MEKETALLLTHFIDHSTITVYEKTKLITSNGMLPKFHQWVERKSVISGYKVTRPDTQTSYYLLFIDWHRNENYYLVIYAHDKSTTFAELRQVEEMDGRPHLLWKYNPLKRDGKNAERKAYFKQTFGSTTIEIPLPKSELEVEGFFNQLFRLCQNRIKADKIVEVFDFDKRTQ